MANTYVLIASNTLTSNAASVTFSSIPGTYTDLVLRWSARNQDVDASAQINLTFNSNTSNYSTTYLRGDGSTAISSNGSGLSNINLIRGAVDAAQGANVTANTFSSGQLYIPSYTASQNKPLSNDWATESNITSGNNASRAVNAGLWQNTAAITSITMTMNASGNFVSGSSFFLYGIKNS